MYLLIPIHQLNYSVVSTGLALCFNSIIIAAFVIKVPLEKRALSKLA